MSTLEERRIGAVVGALVADAAGKYLFLIYLKQAFMESEFNALHSHVYIIAYIYDGCLIEPYKISKLAYFVYM